ncbi:MAG: putative SOS response-associated peptidase YedK [Candidatus Cloacimonetes bacterium ADurb.Bin088]|nr:MAG: putative SOS response-associated peptidase YedK [Candidatus Cloacimonetes bacterium ADurb.Bin088]
MCGRFAQVIKHDQLQKLAKELRLNRESQQLEFNYNLAPTQPAMAVVSQAAGRYLGVFRWGLIPSWSREIPPFPLINVRAETITAKPSFRGGLQRRRCLVPATGFYEWRQSDKQPFFIHAAQGDLLWMAAIYDSWSSPDGSYVPSLGIITTEANSPMRALHHRMPVLLCGDDRLAWLEHNRQDALDFVPLLKPAPDDSIALYPVSKYVNKVGNNSEECLKPLHAS